MDSTRKLTMKLMIGKRLIAEKKLVVAPQDVLILQVPDDWSTEAISELAEAFGKALEDELPGVVISERVKVRVLSVE